MRKISDFIDTEVMAFLSAHLPDTFILGLDDEKSISVWSDGAADYFKIGEHEAIGRNVDDLLDLPLPDLIGVSGTYIRKGLQIAIKNLPSGYICLCTIIAADFSGEILDHISDGFFVLDRNLRYTFVNRHLCEMTGKTEAELLGRNVWDVFPDAVGSLTYHAIEQAFTVGETIVREDYYESLDLWLEARIYPGARGLSVFITDISKRKKAEQQVNDIFASAPDIICIIGTDRRFKKINPAMCRLLGYTEDELLSMSVDELIHSEDLPLSHERMQQFRSGNIHSLSFENRYIKKDSSVVHLSWTASTGQDPGVLYCLAKDISDRKELELLLYRANQLARIGSWEMSPGDGKIYWSDVNRELHEAPLGYQPTRNDLLRFYGKTGKVQLEKLLNAAIKNGESFDTEVELTTLKGNRRWVRIIGESEMVNSVCRRVYGSFQDIDARKQDDLRLRELNNELEIARHRYEQLFQRSPLPKWVFDSETLAFLDVNESAINSYGYSREEFLSMSLRDIRPVEYLGDLTRAAEARKNVEGVFRAGIFKHQKKNGELIEVDIQSNTIDFQGRPARIATVTDVTEKMEYLRAIEDQNAKLRDISWMQSHVIRAPLSRIMGLVNLLESNHEAKANQAEIISYIKVSANELDDVIRNIIQNAQPKEF